MASAVANTPTEILTQFQLRDLTYKVTLTTDEAGPLIRFHHQGEETCMRPTEPDDINTPTRWYGGIISLYRQNGARIISAAPTSR